MNSGCEWLSIIVLYYVYINSIILSELKKCKNYSNTRASYFFYQQHTVSGSFFSLSLIEKIIDDSVSNEFFSWFWNIHFAPNRQLTRCLSFIIIYKYLFFLFLPILRVFSFSLSLESVCIIISRNSGENKERVGVLIRQL